MTERAIPPGPPQIWGSPPAGGVGGSESNKDCVLRALTNCRPGRLSHRYHPAPVVTLVPSLGVGFPGADGAGPRLRTDVRDWCESIVVSSHNSVRATRDAFVTSALGGALVQGIPLKHVDGKPAGTVRRRASSALRVWG